MREQVAHVLARPALCALALALSASVANAQDAGTASRANVPAWAIVEASEREVTLRFGWTLAHPPHFSAGHAIEFPISTLRSDTFVIPANLPDHDPTVGFASNLPCAYRDVYNHDFGSAWSVRQGLIDYCCADSGFPPGILCTDEFTAFGLWVGIRTAGDGGDFHQYTVGSSCPEAIRTHDEIGQPMEYHATYLVRRDPRLRPDQFGFAYAVVNMDEIPDTNLGFTDCPLTTGTLAFTTTTIMRRLCFPTGPVPFNPTVDTPLGGGCYDRDHDTWFDNPGPPRPRMFGTRVADCADDDSSIHPGSAEVSCFDRRDNDCDGRPDCDDSDCETDCTGPTCPVGLPAGEYCALNPALERCYAGRDADLLDYQNGRVERIRTCLAGCVVERAGTPDHCARSARCPTDLPSGFYCGANPDLQGCYGGLGNDLVRYDAGRSLIRVLTCSPSCSIQRRGSDDRCASAPADAGTDGSLPDVVVADAGVGPDVARMDSSTCATGDMVCAGSCVDITTNTAHCGGCGVACPLRANASGRCAGGVCGITCAPAFGDCDGNIANGCETSLSTAAANCGLCGRSCVAGQSCLAGACTCPSGEINCGGSCRVLASDPTNCGTCGTVCPSGWTCSSGICRDPCATVTCPTCTRCATGSCVSVSDGSPCAGGMCTSGSCVATCPDVDGDGHRDARCGGDDWDDSPTGCLAWNGAPERLDIVDNNGDGLHDGVGLRLLDRWWLRTPLADGGTDYEHRFAVSAPGGLWTRDPLRSIGILPLDVCTNPAYRPQDAAGRPLCVGPDSLGIVRFRAPCWSADYSYVQLVECTNPGTTWTIYVTTDSGEYSTYRTGAGGWSCGAPLGYVVTAASEGADGRYVQLHRQDCGAWSTSLFSTLNCEVASGCGLCPLTWFVARSF